jgi:hypothetical protein
MSVKRAVYTGLKILIPINRLTQPMLSPSIPALTQQCNPAGEYNEIQL